METPGYHSVQHDDTWRFFYRHHKFYIFFLFIILLVFSLLYSNTPAVPTDLFNQKLLSEIQKKYGLDAKKRVATWLQLIQDYKDKPEQDKLTAANHFLDQIEYRPDMHGTNAAKDHYWATPLEFLGTGAGDCEEFAISKYFTLKYMGISEDKMRIAYVKVLDINRAHMVLAYYPTPNADPLILDNLILAIKPASERTNLLPVYSFNGGGLWLAKQRLQGGERISGPERLSLWRDLSARMAKELH